MTDGYLAEIRLFAASFAPKYWAYCMGQTLSVSPNQALYALLGNTFGGSAPSTFCLPDFRGRVAYGTGTNPLTGQSVISGELNGVPSITLTANNLPPHSHVVSNASNIPVLGNITATMPVNNSQATATLPKGLYLGVENGGGMLYANAASQNLNTEAIKFQSSTLGVNMASVQISNSGSSYPVDNSMPSLGMNFIICTSGIFPIRS